MQQPSSLVTKFRSKGTAFMSIRRLIQKTGCIAVFCFLSLAPAFAQSLGTAGTVAGAVVDPSGAVITNAQVVLRNPMTGFERTTTTDSSGSFLISNIPANPYQLTVTAPGFAQAEQDVSVRSTVPLQLKIPLALAGQEVSISVEAAGPTLVENVPVAHSDVDQSLLDKLPALSPGSGLNDAIQATSAGVAADSNGFFHPLGDHAQVTYSVDGQPISDQQSKLFSTSIPLNAMESLELITGAPSAEYGDKTSMVVNATTRSGLGDIKPHGSFLAEYGSFGTLSEEATFSMGTSRFGNFLAANSTRSGRFLDTPEFTPIHAIGNNETLFDRLDFQLGSKDTLHFNTFVARNWFQIPNTLDQLGQDQRQKVVTFNIAPGYQHTFSPTTLVTINPFVRRDAVNYYPSADPFADTPATISQQRHLTNWGVRADLAYARGMHDIKVGTQLMQTRLDEAFTLGITDPGFNAVCVDNNGNPQALPTVTDPSGCASRGFVPNPDLLPGLVPFDLTRGGTPLQFKGNYNINEYAFYAQDQITWGALTLNAGLRLDKYDGLVSEAAAEPRAGVSYLVKPSKTVLRFSYTRAFETPYNENLLLSSATGVGGLATNVLGGAGEVPLEPGRRNQYNTGFQQGLGKYLQVDADYFWKFTDNAYDFSTLFNTPITFPISWTKSKIDGVAIRVSTPNLRGFQAYSSMGHNRARYFGPETGGIISSDATAPVVFRIDHDQAFQQATNARYQWHKDGPWANFTWRYDSGLVAGSVPDIAAALGLTAAQQVAIGFFCGSVQATLDNPITSCPSGGGATRLRIPAAGTENDDHNPPRIAPRHLFDLGLGTDNLFHSEAMRWTLRFTITNLTNRVALYNFLSTFSGTHFVAPRTYQAAVGIAF
jgi:Carboxypeptidase regulatory-like domain/TonB-dependent Receptor Plug Domain